MPVEIQDRAGKGFDGAYHADPRTVEGAGNGLCKFCASFVIEKDHCYVIISLGDKIELAFKGYSIVERRKGTVRSVCHTVFDLPVGDELRDGALPSLGLVINIPVTVPFERNGTERAGYEKSADVDKIELLARFVA